MAINKNFVVKNGLEVNGDLLVANPDTNRVGVGTTVPQYDFQVVGDVYADSVIADTFSGSGIGLTSLPADQLIGSLPAIDGSLLTGIFDQDLNTTNDVTFNRIGITTGEINVGSENNLLINVEGMGQPYTYTFGSGGIANFPSNIEIGSGGYSFFEDGGTNSSIQANPLYDFKIHVGGYNTRVTGFGTDGSVSIPVNVVADYYDLRDIGSVGSAGTFLAASANSEFDIITDLSGQGENGPIWRFGIDGSLTLPGGTVATSSSISTPIPNDEFQDGDPFAIRIYRGSDQEYGSFVFENDRLVFPDGNGRIITGGGEWTLDTTNNILGFPSNDLISYDDINGSGFDIFTFEKPIRITAAQSNVWAFSTDGSLTTPGDIIVSSGSSIGIGSTQPTASIDVQGDVRVGVDTSQGIILTSPNGTQYRLIVDDSGNLTTTVI